MKNTTVTLTTTSMINTTRTMTGLRSRRGLTLCSWNTKSNLSEGVGGI